MSEFTDCPGETFVEQLHGRGPHMVVFRILVWLKQHANPYAENKRPECPSVGLTG